MFAPIHDAQMLTYLRLGGWKVGLLINFNVPMLREGLRRKVGSSGLDGIIVAWLPLDGHIQWLKRRM